MVNILPRITVDDFVKFSYNSKLIQKFNPELNENVIQIISDLIIIWEQFCVFEDKLQRIQSYLEEKDEEKAV